MINKIRVLFICIHNSARSQMVEAFLKKYGGDYFEAESAGLEPGNLNPLAVEVMKEKGIDISGNPTKDVFELHKQGKSYDYVITVCDANNAAACPVFPGKSQKLAWWFDDPSQFTGNLPEKLSKTRMVRDQIEVKVREFINEYRKVN